MKNGGNLFLEMFYGFQCKPPSDGLDPLVYYHPWAISLILLIFFATVDNFPQASRKDSK